MPPVESIARQPPLAHAAPPCQAPAQHPRTLLSHTHIPCHQPPPPRTHPLNPHPSPTRRPPGHAELLLPLLPPLPASAPSATTTSGALLFIKNTDASVTAAPASCGGLSTSPSAQ